MYPPPPESSRPAPLFPTTTLFLPDRTIERHGWFDRSLRNNARASQATDEPGQESSRNYPKTEHFRTTPWSHFHHRTGGRPNWADDIGNSRRRIRRAAARTATE